MQQTITYATARLREPSTWVSIAMLLLHLPAAVKSNDWQAVGATVAAVLGVVLPERKE